MNYAVIYSKELMSSVMSYDVMEYGQPFLEGKRVYIELHCHFVVEIL